jgi:hypothetical protein
MMTDQPAAGGPPAGAPASAQQHSAADGAASAQSPAADWKQLGIPSHMLKDTPETTLQEVFKGYKGFLDRQAQQGPAGKSADDYRFDFADDLKPYFPNGDDPALAAFRAAAHKMGLPVKTANALINETFGPLAREGKLAQPFNPQAEIEGISRLLGKTGAEAAPAIEQATTELTAWATNAGQQMQLSESAQIELESLLLTASGFELVQKLRGASGGQGFRLGGVAPGQLSRADLEAMQNDPRFSPSSPKYDRAFRERYEAGWRALPLDQIRRA